VIDITARTAGILGLPEDESRFRALAETTKNAFHRVFFEEGTGSYGDGGGNILALKMGVPSERYQRVIKALKAGLQKTRGHLDTGIIGTRFFFEVLAENGLQEMAFEAMNKRDAPGFGRWVELGSTTSREQWDEGGSHNHPMFGGGLVWFYRNLAGMQADPDRPGYRHIVFRPQPVKELEQVSYYTQTSFGRGGIAWINKPGEFKMNVTVPVGCEATVFVQASDPGMVMEGNVMAAEADGVILLGMEEGYVVFRVVSGDYAFSVNRES
jgi:alpha-L-rhamnosidase